MQDITLSEHRTTATFDELCDNYAMERLQMLFHDSTFTAEQERYIQEEIQYSFSDVVASPLPVIDVIDRNVPMVSVRMDVVGGWVEYVSVSVVLGGGVGLYVGAWMVLWMWLYWMLC